MLERFFYKHQPYAWEHEFRIAISLRLAEEFGVLVPEGGIEVPCDIRALVDAVIVGPNISATDASVARDVCRTGGLESVVALSSLYGVPRHL
jgi:hypothetical protein